MLSRSLRARKLAFALKLEQLQAERDEREAAERDAAEMRAAREMMGAGAAADAPSGDAAPAARPPFFKLLLTEKQLLPLINQALMETAKCIHEGQRIDSHVSVAKDLRKALASAAEDDTTA